MKKVILIILVFNTLLLQAQIEENIFKPKPLTRVSDVYPCISKDGSIVVFSSNRDGDYDLYISNLKKNTTSQLINLPGNEGHPDISPDGSQVTFYATIGDVKNDHREIYIANIDGTDIRKLTNAIGTSFHPKFNSRGDKILYNRQINSEEDKYEFYVINLKTGNQQKILSDTRNITFASFSPDDSKLVFVKWFKKMNTEVFIADSNGKNQKNISNNQLFDGWPTWTSDGESILFSSDRSKKFHFHIYQYNLNTEIISQITFGERQYVQPSASNKTIVANSSFSRDGSSQIVMFENKISNERH